MNTMCKDQLNVEVKLPLSFDLQEITGINRVVQVFPPGEFPDIPEDFHSWYIVYVDEDNLETVKEQLSKHPGVQSVEKIPLRMAWFD